MTEQPKKTLDVVVDGNIFPEFADVSLDYNPIHRDREVAKIHGFDDTPTQGVLLQAYFEKCALINNMPVDVSSLTFKNPAYPGNKLHFSFENSDVTPGFYCRNQDGKLIAQLIPKPREPFVVDESRKIAIYENSLFWQDAEKFKQLVGFREVDESVGYFPRTLVSSLVPASLLRFVSDLGGSLTGVYRRIGSTFWAKPQQGKYTTNIYFKKAHKRGNIYDFEYSCSNDEQGRVSSGDIRVIAEKKLALEEQAAA